MTTMQALANRDIILEIGAERTLAGVNVQVGNIKEGVSVRRRATERLNRHGNYSEAGTRGPRLVTVDGIFWADTPEDAARAEDDLRSVLADGELGRLVKQTVLGRRWANCYLFGTPDVVLDTETDGEFSIDFECPDPRWYGDLVTMSTGVQKAGGGLQLPMFVASASGQTVQTNLALNPRSVGTAFSANNVQWTSTNVTGIPATPTGVTTATKSKKNAGTDPQIGSWFNIDGLASGPASVRSVGAWVWASAAGYIATMFAGGVNSADVPLPSQTWTWVSVTSTTDGGYVGALVGRADGASANLTDYCYITGITAVTGSVRPTTHWDGSTAEQQIDADTVATHAWTGTPNASASTRTTTDYAGPGAGIAYFGEGGSPGTVTWTNPGKADVSPVFNLSNGNGFTITEVETQRRIIYTGTVLAGQYVEIDANEGTVNLNGTIDRSSELALAQWPIIPGGATRTYMLESISPTATLEMQVYPAWW